jgi:hypothetical protein
MKYLSLALTLLMLVCANKTDSSTSATRLAINNTNAATVTTVTVTNAADTSKTVTFSTLTGNTTTASQEIAFSGSSNVTCSSGCNAGAVILTANQTNTITILAATAPTTTATSSGGGSSGW